MRVCIYEHTWATNDATLADLRVEGRSMLAAVLTDFAGVPGVRPTTLAAQEHGPFAAWPTRLIPPGEELAALQEEAQRADWTLVIAPESGGVLAACCRAVEAVGGRLLGPSVAGVELGADKLRLAHHWQQRGVRTPTTVVWPTAVESLGFPAVCKPRFGAGAQATFRVAGADDLAAAVQQAAHEGFATDLIVQPLVPGQAASIAWLTGAAEPLPLLPASQEIANDGRFTYRGGWLPLSAEWSRRAVAVSRPAIAAVPGLLGYVSVDLVLGSAADGSEDFVIELNPRLTTSYVGLRSLAESNLAEAMLAMAAGTVSEPLRWRSGTIRFTPEGRVERYPG